MPSLTASLCVLRNVPLFSHFSDEQLRMLLPAVESRTYGRHSPILRAGEPTDALYVIVAGRACVLMDDGNGRQIVLDELGPNEFFGEMSLIDSQPRSANVEALDDCHVLYIAKPAFMTCLQGNFDAAMLMLRGVVGRLRDADRKIGSLALMDVYGRVARLLIECAKEVDGRWIAAIGSEQMSRRVGSSREMVSRVLKDLREKGIVAREKRKIVILDRASMADRAER
jgi:CRP/FNR family transcriptional regulator, cyclic AMP receptor protein